MSSRHPLEGLHDIPWSRLHHVYGPADDLPPLIERLLSDEPEDVSFVLNQLDLALYHQGDITDATPHVLTYLIRILSHDSFREKGELLSFLSLYGEMFEGIRDERKIEEIFSEIPDQPAWAKETFRILKSAAPLFKELVRHPDPVVRFRSALFGEDEETHDLLLRQLISEPETGCKVHLIMALSRIGLATNECVRHLTELSENGTPSVLAHAARRALVRILGERTPDSLIVRLLTTSLLPLIWTGNSGNWITPPSVSRWTGPAFWCRTGFPRPFSPICLNMHLKKRANTNIGSWNF